MNGTEFSCDTRVYVVKKNIIVHQVSEKGLGHGTHGLEVSFDPFKDRFGGGVVAGSIPELEEDVPFR